MIELKRLFKHLLSPQWRTRRVFPKHALRAIEEAIASSETRHQGELRFIAEGGLDLSHLLHGTIARERALELFSRFRVWDTEHNSGVLIYVQLVDRQVEILADRGIHKKVGNDAWQRICHEMEQAFRADRFEAGAVAGIQAVGQILAEHFPADTENPDELPNTPAMI